MLDAKEARLTRTGTVTIAADSSILVEGFEAEGGTCRDVAALAAVWAIGRLQAELTKTLEKPGAGGICLG